MQDLGDIDRYNGVESLRKAPFQPETGKLETGILKMVLQIQVNLSGAIRKDSEANIFVSYCPALKLYSQGEDERQALEAIKSAVMLFLTTCIDRGQLDAALRAVGFDKTSAGGMISVEQRMSEWIAIKEAKFDEAFEFTVPINLIAAKQAAECQP